MMATMNEVIETFVEMEGHEEGLGCYRATLCPDELERIIVDCWSLLEDPDFDSLRKKIMRKLLD